MNDYEAERRAARNAGIAFVISAAGSIALAVTYGFGGQAQLEGVFLFVALGGLACGLVLWGKHLVPGGRFVQEREPHASPALERGEALDSLGRGEQQIARRGFLAKVLGAALGAMGIAALFPIRSLGSAPGRSLFHTQWTEGALVVDSENLPVAADRLSSGGILTVFPEHHVDDADSQVLLIRLSDEGADALSGEPAADGYVAFSKVCTHAGCPVGLYEPAANQLFCPCHQSAFDVLEDAKPVAGPATRALPRLPIEVDENGLLVARGDFTEPIGPGFWNRLKDDA